MIMKLRLLTILIIMTLSLGASSELSECRNDFRKAVEVNQVYKSELSSCEKTRDNCKTENKYLQKVANEKDPSIVPFTKIKSAHLHGFVIGAIVGLLI